jgi:16S rRNA (cytidine1402-2'-O)-methyltransferase
MEQLIEFCGQERNAVVCREISKIYEDKIRGNLSDILTVMQADKNKTKGEIVIVVEGLQKTKNEKDLAEDETD